MSDLSEIAQHRLDMLHEQREAALALRRKISSLHSECGDCGWEDVLGAMEDVEDCITTHIYSIAEWDNERARDHAEELADFRRGLRDDD